MPTLTPTPTSTPTPAPTPTPTAEPVPPKVAIDSDGMTARASGDLGSLYARVALVIETRGQSGLYVTQASIAADGTIAIPRLMVPGLTVRAISVALVGTLGDIPSSTPVTTASDFIVFVV